MHKGKKRNKDMTNFSLERRRLGKLLTLGLGTAALGTVASKFAAAAPVSDQADLVQRANITLEEAQRDPEFGMAKDLFQSAKAVMVVPQLVKGGFFFGAEGGNGILVAREGNHWSNPAFYTLASASFGLQIGLEVAEVVLFVQSDRALRAWMTNEVKLGGQAGLTVLVLGSSAAAAATTHLNVDVIAWAKAKGAYAGLTLEGSIIKQRNEWNAAYYGHPVSPARLLNMASR
jgi:lipid-binding SYLF domain-containing protein